MLASLTHLGNKKNAWRVFSNVKRSSLSKEVLFTGLFGLGLLLVLLGIFLHQRPDIFLLLTSVAGAGMVYHMAQVYRLPAAPGWNSWRTNAGFFVSALLLGIAAMIPLLTFESNMTGIRVPSVQWGVTGFSVLVLLLAQFSLMRNPAAPDSIQRTRIEFMLIGTALAAIITVHVGASAPVVSMLMSVFVVSAEILGRWVFYRSRL
jgi:DMSO reductase anchor subunit